MLWFIVLRMADTGARARPRGLRGLVFHRSAVLSTRAKGMQSGTVPALLAFDIRLALPPRREMMA